MFIYLLVYNLVNMDAKKLRQKALAKARKRVTEKKRERDQLLVNAVDAIDELDDLSNILVERVKNWYAFHFPELEKLVKSPESYLTIITSVSPRASMTQESLKPFSPKAKNIATIARGSIGADLSKKDLDEISGLAKLTLSVKKERDQLAAYVESTAKELCPNMSYLAGGMLSARLISAAGSLKKLAQFPSSTVQVLGAEKALFAHLRSGVNPPKHGLIFAFPAVRQANLKKRGRIARRVANKLSIAARIDFFKHGLDPSLKKNLDKQLAQVK